MKQTNTFSAKKIGNIAGWILAILLFILTSSAIISGILWLWRITW